MRKLVPIPMKAFKPVHPVLVPQAIGRLGDKQMTPDKDSFFCINTTCLVPFPPCRGVRLKMTDLVVLQA